MKELIQAEGIEQRIFMIRGHRVMVDRDLAELYGVKTKYLNQQVRRNIRRFPGEFMFSLTKNERDELVAICNRFESLKHSAYLPLVFTEHGATMLASVLNSERAVKISIIVVKAFIRLREIVSTHKELACKINELGGRLDKHDSDIQNILKALKQLLYIPKIRKRVIKGFASH